jgi:hypothetical protein
MRKAVALVVLLSAPSTSFFLHGHKSKKCTCQNPCDLNTATKEDLLNIINPFNLTKLYGTKAGVTPDELAYESIVAMRPICNPMELATAKKVYIQPGNLPVPERPNPGYLLSALWGCGGNQGLYGTLGGRGGCCPVVASSLFCSLKRLFGTKALNRNTYTKAQYDKSCNFRMPYTKVPLNPPPECYIADKIISFEEVKMMARELGEEWTDSELHRMVERADADKDGAISEDEFLFFMGKKRADRADAPGQLDGLPRISFVREPWERTKKSTMKDESLRKCATHYGTKNCHGLNPVIPFTYDIDKELEDRKKHPDCRISYKLGSYYTVESGEVWCTDPDWYPRWVGKQGQVRCACYPPPISKHPTDVELYPGCAATRKRCKTPPDWSQYS